LKISDADKNPSGQCEYRMAGPAYLHSLDSRIRPAIYYEATGCASSVLDLDGGFEQRDPTATKPTTLEIPL
jgi:hypothetical protein